MFAGISAFAQTNEEIYDIAKKKSKELVVTFNLTKEQKTNLVDTVNLFEQNKLDYSTPSVYPNSKFAVMRENYAAALLPKLKEILTEEQYNTFVSFL
ncbi:hypothetical protein NBRC110019_18520 [Neptunitalea chrysea]|uniref:Uncharacterized protein n=2 Tax=Neptunitalea chrysea TaxID=1647581 RepID=A0A9W6B7N2_9FLAO|nr:hypothetical protein NBRC110019_18520 [Neptunitalea chrysea]